MIALVWALSACSPPAAVELRDAPPDVAATDAWTVRVDATLPTDLVPLPDGGFLVLDGYEERALVYDDSHTLVRTLEGKGRWDRPIRAIPATDGGFWLASAEGHALLRIDERGRVKRTIPLGTTAAPVEPVALLATSEALVVSDRDGALRWIDPDDGHEERVVRTDSEGEPLAVIGDLTPARGGGFWAVDTLGTHVSRFTDAGVPLGRFGTYGNWVGTLRKPTSAAEAPSDTLLVVDSALSAVQVFDTDGHAVATLSLDGAPFRPAFPSAVRALGSGDFAVLDAGADAVAVVHGFHIDEASIARARGEGRTRWLRTSLVDAPIEPPAECLQCHAGLVRDSREVWDPELGHHPVDVVPDRAVPPFFPLHDGKIVCVTCHSPHGASTLAEVAGVTDELTRDRLVPHATEAGDSFTRMRRTDSSLCVACHEDDAHAAALARRTKTTGTSHPVGDRLAELLAERDEAATPKAGCLGCHAVHGADPDGMPHGERDRDLCGACHPERLDPVRNHPNGCRSCHDLVGGRTDALVRAPEHGRSLCLSCHTELAAPMTRAHGTVPGRLGEPCLGCHEPHGATVDPLLERIGHRDPTGCLACHADGGIATKAGVDPGTRGHPVDGRPSDQGPLACLTCHDAHDPEQPKLACGDCHAEEKHADERGGHGTADCLDCHPMHGAAPAMSAPGDINPASTRCLACHAEGAVDDRGAPDIVAFQHPAPMFTPGGVRWTPLAGLPLFDDAGAVVPTGESGALTCQSCHLVHGPDADKPGDNLRRPDWRAACSSCHGEDSLLLYRWYHQPDRWQDAGGAP